MKESIFSNIQEIVDALLKNLQMPAQKETVNDILSSYYPISHLVVMVNPLLQKLLLKNKIKFSESKEAVSEESVVPENIAFIKVSSFNNKKNSLNEKHYNSQFISKNIKIAGGQEYIILDLRDNTGGELKNLVACCKSFFKEKKLAYSSTSEVDTNHSQTLPELLTA